MQGANCGYRHKIFSDIRARSQQIPRESEDIEKILQRYPIALTAHDDKLELYSLAIKAL
jgi:hypothetical protein